MYIYKSSNFSPHPKKWGRRTSPINPSPTLPFNPSLHQKKLQEDRVTSHLYLGTTHQGCNRGKDLDWDFQSPKDLSHHPGGLEAS